MSSEKKFGKGFVCGVLTAAVIGAAGGAVIGNLDNLSVPKLAEETETNMAEPAGLNLDLERVEEKISEIEGVVNRYGLDEADEVNVEDHIYKGLLAGLGDDYAAYYNEEELKGIIESTSGEYKGIGAKLSQDAQTGVITVVTCFEGSPSEKAGMLPGDVLYTVNEEEVTGKDLTDVVSVIKTAEGDTVHIQVARDGEKDYLDFYVERADIEVPTITSKMLENNIGYIIISEFDSATVDQFKLALEELESQGMEKLIIDLRNNLGGVLDGCCEMLRQILPEGLIVYTEDKYGVREEYTCDGANEFTKPLVVLVNEYSASAAEIFSGAVKDHGVGILVGTTTFGKGIVQRIVNLDDGTAVKLTISKYYTPNGTDIHKKGIEPDVKVELDEELWKKVVIEEEEDNQLQKAIEIIKEQE